MNGSKAWTRWLLAAAAAVALVPLPALGGPVAQQGADLWITIGDGVSLSSFADDPIPAGFFCTGSQPFADDVAVQGVPLAADPGDGLGSIDTIVRRLDDAVFDAQGVARTRIQMMALSLHSARPIATDCGRYQVGMTLAGEQPVTEMRIVQKWPTGGTYEAPLSFNVRMAFEPIEGNTHPRRELVRRVDLGPGSVSVWSFVEPAPARTVRVDTDGNGVVDAVLPPPSNFQAGLEPVVPAAAIQPVPSCYPWLLGGGGGTQPLCPVGYCPRSTCHCNPVQSTWNPCTDPLRHCDPGHQHCIWICVRCEVDEEPISTGG